MTLLFLSAALAGTYLYASVNLAILLTRLIMGQDLRTLAAGTAGTANTSRVLGKGWAFLVFLFDLSKGLLPVLLVRHFLFPDPTVQATLALVAVAAAAIIGHCRPVFFGLRGGGGVVTAMGALFALIPVELLLAMVLGFGAVELFMRKSEFRLGRRTPMLFLAIAPVLTLLSGFWLDVPIAAGIRLGGKPWHVAAGALALGLLVFFLNLRLFRSGRRAAGS